MTEERLATIRRLLIFVGPLRSSIALFFGLRRLVTALLSSAKHFLGVTAGYAGSRIIGSATVQHQTTRTAGQEYDRGWWLSVVSKSPRLAVLVSSGVPVTPLRWPRQGILESGDVGLFEFRLVGGIVAVRYVAVAIGIGIGARFAALLPSDLLPQFSLRALPPEFVGLRFWTTMTAAAIPTVKQYGQMHGANPVLKVLCLRVILASKSRAEQY